MSPTFPNRRERKSQEPRLSVTDRTLNLTLVGEKDFQYEPDIVHRAKFRFYRFAHADVGGAPVKHKIDLVVQRELFQIWYDREDELTEERWLQLFAKYAMPHAPKVLTPDRLLVARLKMEEFPVSACGMYSGTRWTDWMDANGAGNWLEGLPRLLDEANEGRYKVEGPLIDGSLFWLKLMGVHPLLRGQGIGACLMAHALWAVQRSVADLAILEAYPEQTVFEAECPKRSAKAVSNLVSYYQTVGFNRLLKTRIVNTADPMYVQFGAFGLPVEGLGGMTVIPNPKKKPPAK